MSLTWSYRALQNIFEESEQPYFWHIFHIIIFEARVTPTYCAVTGLQVRFVCCLLDAKVLAAQSQNKFTQNANWHFCSTRGKELQLILTARVADVFIT